METSAQGVFRDPGSIDFGASVVDRGRDFANRSERYILGYYSKDGLTVATSSDGLDWKLLSPTSVLKHNHDIISLRWDPLRQRFLATVSVLARGSLASGLACLEAGSREQSETGRAVELAFEKGLHTHAVRAVVDDLTITGLTRLGVVADSL
jgi:hypothetical protein